MGMPSAARPGGDPPGHFPSPSSTHPHAGNTIMTTIRFAALFAVAAAALSATDAQAQTAT